ncbi:MAG: hypothetical protein KatS3mg035_1370 [Bacteroidia bacterium]|nr:MAG: hypothetical protein KatS3mg035_1370 [Bacteroidia bacterium]
MRIFILFPIIFVNFFLYSQKRNSIFCFADSVLIRFDQDTFYIDKSNLSLIPAPPPI